MTIILATPYEYTIKAPVIKTVTELKIDRTVDLPNEKKVNVWLSGFPEPVTIWEGEAYDAIGQWTDTDVEERLIEIFSA